MEILLHMEMEYGKRQPFAALVVNLRTLFIYASRRTLTVLRTINPKFNIGGREGQKTHFLFAGLNIKIMFDLG